MAQLHFTAWLRDVAPNGPVNAAGATVGEALGSLLTECPHLRSYLLDDQGRLRKHVCIFADGSRLASGAALGHRVGPETRLYVMQALSGG
jgi:hypothetical protein